MKKNITMLLFGLAISVGSWIAPLLNGGEAPPSATDMLKQEIVKTQAQGADSPFGESKPDPSSTKLLNALSGQSAKPHPLNWGVVLGLVVIAGGAVLSIKALGAKAAESFPGGSDPIQPTRMDW